MIIIMFLVTCFQLSIAQSEGKRVDKDIEEFYFDDELNPDLYKERYMRLQSTIDMVCNHVIQNHH